LPYHNHLGLIYGWIIQQVVLYIHFKDANIGHILASCIKLPMGFPLYWSISDKISLTELKKEVRIHTDTKTIITSAVVISKGIIVLDLMNSYGIKRCARSAGISVANALITC
jgi:hypothetical protein